MVGESPALVILGSGSGLPQAERATSGYAVQVDQMITLLDCGGGVTSSYLRANLSPDNLERIFLSHTHPDHCCELPLMLQLVYLSGCTRPLDLYLPEEFVSPFRDYLNAVYLMPEKLPFDLNIVGYNSGFELSAELEVTVSPTRHLDGYTDMIASLGLPNRMQSFSFEVSVGERTLYYSSDIADPDDLRPHLDKADTVLVETTHVDVEELLEIVAESPQRQFVFTHLGSPAEVEHLRTAIERHGVGNAVLAEDGLTIPL